MTLPPCPYDPIEYGNLASRHFLVSYHMSVYMRYSRFTRVFFPCKYRKQLETIAQTDRGVLTNVVQVGSQTNAPASVHWSVQVKSGTKPSGLGVIPGTIANLIDGILQTAMSSLAWPNVRCPYDPTTMPL